MTLKHIAKSGLIVFLLLFQLTVNYVVAEEVVVRVAVRAHSGEEAAHKKWGETMDYLSRNIPGYRFVMVPFIHNTGLIQAVSQGGFGFVLTNPSAFVELQIRYGVKPLATLINKRQGKGYMQFGSVIFTRAERSDIQDYEDLKGKIFMAVDEKGFGGWRVAWLELLENGIDPFLDFAEVRFAGGLQEEVVKAVRDGKVDAGSVRTDMLERLADKGLITLSDFKVLGLKEHKEFPFLLSSRLYPEWSFSQTKTTSNQLGVQVLNVLRDIRSDLSAAKKGKYVGWIKSLDYSSVKDLMGKLHVGPFHITSYETWAIFWSQYKYYLLAFVSGVIILLYTVMVGARKK